MKKIKKRKTYHSNIHQNIEFDKYLVCEENFDIEGNLIEGTHTNEDGEIEAIEKREYEINNLVKYIYYNTQTEVEQVSTYKYADDLLIEEIEYFTDTSFIKSKIQYDNDRRILAIEKTDEDGKYIEGKRNKYSPNETLEEIIDETQIVIQQLVTKLDAEGKEIEILNTSFDDEKNLLSERTTKTKFIYQGENIVNVEIKRSDKVIFKQKNEYDTRNNLIKCVIEDHLDDFLVTLEFEYNQLNFETSVIEFNDKKRVYAKKTKYDSFNNIVEVVEETHMLGDYLAISKQEIKHEYR